MEFHRIIPAGTVVLIIVVTLASGPLVGISLTTEAEQFEPGHGTLNATVVSTPDRATLEAAGYGVEEYHLRSPPVELRIDDFNGQPAVSYDVVIHDLGYTRSSVTFLDSSSTGSYQLGFESKSLDADRVERGEYSGTLRIVVINGDEARTLFEKDIRIEVQE